MLLQLLLGVEVTASEGFSLTRQNNPRETSYV